MTNPTYHKGERNFGTGFDMMKRIAELEAENERLREALERIDEASNHYAMTPTYSEGVLRYAHKSTRNLARAAIRGNGEDEG